MKRILLLILVVVLVFGAMTSCDLPFDIPFFGNNDDNGDGNGNGNGNGDDTTEETDIQEAVKELNDMYEDFNGSSTANDYELIASLSLDKTLFTINWSSDNANVKVELVDGLWVVDVPEEAAEQFEYKLTATITTAGGQEATVVYNRVVPGGIGMITTPEVGKAYKFALLHGNEKKVVYFDGSNYNGYAWYLAYTDDQLAAVDVYLETVEGVEGGYRLYYDKDGEKTYIVAFPRDGDTTKGTLKLDTEVPTEYYTWSTEYNTLIYTSVTGEQFYIGSSGTYKSISLSAYSYITGATSYVAHLYGAGGIKEELPEQELPEVPENYTSQDLVDALYKLESGQTLEGPYEITGVITSIKYPYDPGYNNISVNIVVEGREDKPVLCYRIIGGETLKVGDTITVFAGLTNYGGTYETTSGGVIRNIIEGDGTLPEQPEVPSDVKGILDTLYGLADGESVTGTFTITGKITALDNYNNPTIVVEGFENQPVYCYRLVVTNAIGDVITVTATTMKNYGGTYEFMNCTLVENGDDPDPKPEDPTYIAPVAGKAYDLFMELPTGKVYFAGSMSGDYLATTTDAAASAKIYFEEVTGGYHIYFMNGDVKTYITAAAYLKSNGYAGCHFSLTTETPTLAWTYDTTYGIIEIYDEIEGKSDTFFAGTYGTYSTVSLSGAYYKDQIASGSQYPARIELSENGGSDTPVDPHEHVFVDGKCECGATDPNYTPETPVEPDDGVYTILEALQAPSGTKVTIKGTVVSFYEDWSSYNNCSPYIADEAGNKILIFRTTTHVYVGDQITVTGTVTLYNEVNQIAKDGSVVTIDVPHTCSYTDATCVDAAICTSCGAIAEGSVALGHTEPNEEGKCGRCGLDLSVNYVTNELSFSDNANRTTFTTSQQVWEQNGVKLTNDKGSSTSNVADYANPARFYKSSKITIEYANMTKIEFVCNSSSYATALQNSIAADTNYTVTVSGSTVTVTFVEAVNSFVIATLSGGQVRMNSLSVTAIG